MQKARCKEIEIVRVVKQVEVGRITACKENAGSRIFLSGTAGLGCLYDRLESAYRIEFSHPKKWTISWIG